MKQILSIILLFAIVLSPATGQTVRDSKNRTVHADPNKEKKRQEENRAKAKIGIRTWTVNEKSGLTDSVPADTMHHLFQNSVFTEGPKGYYASLGNVGSPRQARLFTLRPEMNYFIFTQPYDFFIKPMSQWHFTNTYSPITNITYHECGTSENGEDRLIAKFATNINKDAGVGFCFDYLYGRGYFENQSTADFGFNLYGSVIKDKYNAHWQIYTNYLKTAENGGITDDEYVINPQRFPSSYTTKEIPTNYDKVWNKMHFNGLQLTHRYSMGYRKLIKKDTTKLADSTANAFAAQDTMPHEIQKTRPQNAISASEIDKKYNAQNDFEFIETTKPKDDSTIFVPVTSVIHTLKAGINTRKFLANQSLRKFYTNNYLPTDSVEEDFDNVQVSNYLGLELSEGLNKYLTAGIRLYAQHDFNNYKMPGLVEKDNFTENRFTIGAEIFREQSKHLNYLLTAQTSSDGDSWGEFELRGNGKLTVPLFNDSVSLALRASVVNRKPTFYYRHFQSKYIWWDNDKLDKQFTNHIGATLESQKLALRLSGDIYNNSNYTYFGTSSQTIAGDKGPLTTVSNAVYQSDKSINILCLSLEKDFVFGPLHWENAIHYQTTSDKYILPLPAFTAYTNLYLKFKIARVLSTEFGADLKYFTKYYAPTYSAAIGQFANQSSDDLIKVGNHPVISAYVNFHLKHTRFYLMVSHLNHTDDGGTTFGAPHYPINPMVIRFGLSWNFFN